MSGSPNAYFEQHKGFAHAQAHIIARRLPRHVPIDDVIAFAERGLWEASERFDPKRFNSFSTFAYYRIRGAILDEVRKIGSVPPSVLRKVAAVSGEDEYLENNVPAPRPTDSAEEQAKQISRIIRGLGAVFLAATTRDEDGDEKIDAVDDADPADRVADDDVSERVIAARRALPERQRKILRMHYEEFISFTDIAAEMKVNKATISREHGRAIETLRQAAGVPTDSS